MDAVLTPKQLGEKLNLAIDMRQWDEAVSLMHQGADTNVLNPRNNLYPLQRVSQLGHVEMVRELLAHKADPRLTASGGQANAATAMHYAAMLFSSGESAIDAERAEIIKLLHAAGGSVHAQDGNGFTPLMFSVANNLVRASRALVGCGADPGKNVHFHALETMPEQAEAKISKKFYAGNPTHRAANATTDVFDIMVRAGGNITVKNPEGKDARALIATRTHDGMKARLKHYMKAAFYQPLVSDAPLTLTMLTKPVGEGEGCMLDHPAVWHKADRLFADLDASGESLSKAMLLEPRAEAGSWLGMAIACRALEPLLAHLEARGETLTVEDLLEADGQTPRPELEAMQDYSDLPKLVAHWQATLEPRAQMHSYRALPEDAARSLPIHQLQASAQRALRQESFARGV